MTDRRDLCIGGRMKMKEIEFNLLDEPWIRVLLPDYQVKEVSLT